MSISALIREAELWENENAAPDASMIPEGAPAGDEADDEASEDDAPLRMRGRFGRREPARPDRGGARSRQRAWFQTTEMPSPAAPVHARSSDERPSRTRASRRELLALFDRLDRDGRALLLQLARRLAGPSD